MFASSVAPLLSCGHVSLSPYSAHLSLWQTTPLHSGNENYVRRYVGDNAGGAWTLCKERKHTAHARKAYWCACFIDMSQLFSPIRARARTRKGSAAERFSDQ
jgi:hypothetical protein